MSGKAGTLDDTCLVLLLPPIRPALQCCHWSMAAGKTLALHWAYRYIGKGISMFRSWQMTLDARFPLYGCARLQGHPLVVQVVTLGPSPWNQGSFSAYLWFIFRDEKQHRDHRFLERHQMETLPLRGLFSCFVGRMRGSRLEYLTKGYVHLDAAVMVVVRASSRSPFEASASTPAFPPSSVHRRLPSFPVPQLQVYRFVAPTVAGHTQCTFRVHHRAATHAARSFRHGQLVCGRILHAGLAHVRG